MLLKSSAMICANSSVFFSNANKRLDNWIEYETPINYFICNDVIGLIKSIKQIK
mgnify:CR=1 FL=1